MIAQDGSRIYNLLASKIGTQQLSLLDIFYLKTSVSFRERVSKESCDYGVF